MLTPHQPDNLKLGFVGLGDHAFEQLLPAIKITSGLELTALSSRTPDKLEKFANKFQPKFTTGIWQDLLDPNVIGGIVVSASPQLHYEVAKECIVRGIHCFIEKPPTQNLGQLKELIELKKPVLVKLLLVLTLLIPMPIISWLKLYQAHP
jgi:predicted dehydrogenase